jgi:glycoside/pentoside/hexuronide:cation symporter, GPH family
MSLEAPAPTATPSSAPLRDRLPVRTKLVYGLGSVNDMWGNWLYPGMVWPVFNIFLHVNPALVSLALMINRLFDAVSDPFFGWLSDNTRSRWGRRRPYILLGSALAGLGLPLLFTVSMGWSEMGYFWYMVVSSAIFITIVSCFKMPYDSLGAELTPDYHERTSVYAYKSAVQKIPEIAMFMAAAFCTATVWAGATRADALDRLGLMATRSLEWFNAFFSSLLTLQVGRLIELAKTPFGWEPAVEGGPAPNILLGAQVYTTILGIIMVLVGIVLFVSLKERYYDHVVSKHSAQNQIKLSETLWRCLRCRPFRALLAMSLAYGLGTSMVGTLGYYATVYYVCGGNVTLGSLWNFGMGLSSMVLGLIGIPVFAFIARRFGKIRGMMTVQLSAIVVFVATWWLYTPQVQWMQLFASGFIAFTGAGFWMLHGSIMADVIDSDELESAKRREGAFYACNSWIMKIGMALGIGLSGVILKTTGFDAQLGGNQTEGAILNIRFYLAAIPIAGLIVALIALSRFPLTRERMQQIRAQLEDRRGTV